jgi:hypothetical protein
VIRGVEFGSNFQFVLETANIANFNAGVAIVFLKSGNGSKGSTTQRETIGMIKRPVIRQGSYFFVSFAEALFRESPIDNQVVIF